MERRVCVGKHFETYFRLSLSGDTLSTDQIAELVRRADDRIFVQEEMRRAAGAERRNGKSLVPVYLGELTTHASRIDKTKVEPFLSALFEIHDEIDLVNDGDRGFSGTGNTTLRYYWLIRAVTRDRYSLKERTEIYLAALRSASLGWLANFVSSAVDDYSDREDRSPRREEDCLVDKDAVHSLAEFALQRIRSAATDGELIQHPDLTYILYRWRDFSNNDPTEVRAWVSGQIKDRQSLTMFARAFTSQSYSAAIGGFGGLGDRVALAKNMVTLRKDADILDLDALLGAMRGALHEEGLDADSLTTISTFLAAWDNDPY